MSQKHVAAVCHPQNYSQNFLTSAKTIHTLLNDTDINHCDTVVEIGTGKGHITRQLAKRCKKVITYEIDPRLFKKLDFSKYPNVHAVKADFLQCTLPKGPYKVFANIPFSITTEIIKKLSETPPVCAWVLMEKGAVKRFCGQPRESVQSLLLKPFFDVKAGRSVHRTAFHPMPKVDTAVLCLSRKAVSDIRQSERRHFETFVRQGLTNGLTGRRGMLTKKQVSVALKKMGLPPIQQSDTMLYVQWLCLFRCFCRFGER